MGRSPDIMLSTISWSFLHCDPSKVCGKLDKKEEHVYTENTHTKLQYGPNISRLSSWLNISICTFISIYSILQKNSASVVQKLIQGV